MKIIRQLFLCIYAIFRVLYKWVDKCIVVPITKIILFVNDKFGGRSGRFEKWLTRKSTLIFVSLIISILVFIYVDRESNIILDASAEVLYDQEVQVTYNAEAYVIEGLPDTVDVTLIGRRVDLYLAKQLATGKVTADLSGYGEGPHKINLNYENPISSVSYKLDPSIVNITVYPKVSKTMNMTIDTINLDKIDSKLAISNVTLDQTEVIVKGASHTLDEVASVKALVDVSKIVDPTVGKVVMDDVNVVCYDSLGNVVDVETVPSKVSATITIESPSKEVSIKPIPVGNVEFGKAIDTIIPSVTKVIVYGNSDVLDKLESIPVEVDVSGLSGDKDFNVVLSKPNGVSDISVSTAVISVKLDDEITKEFDDITIAAINLDPELKAVAANENSSKTTVIVKGTKSVLDSIDSSKIKAEVDLADFKEGKYDVKVNVFGEDVRASYTSKTTKVGIKISKK